MRLIFLFVISLFFQLYAEQQSFPVAYQGRFRPFESYFRLNQEGASPDLFWKQHFQSKDINDDYKSALQELEKGRLSPEKISTALETQFPLWERLRRADATLAALPSWRGEGEWLPLKALKVTVYNPEIQSLEWVPNFTLYSDEEFQSIRSAYLAFESGEDGGEELAMRLYAAYKTLAGTPYKEALGKNLYYPTLGRLQAEALYYHYPFIAIVLIAYACAAAFFLLASGLHLHLWNILGWSCLAFAFAIHTALLALRCYILGRPPVSNMYETVIYVPWITVLASLLLYGFLRNRALLIASSLASLILIALLQVTHLDNALENVQAVLDSQYWLIIHVLLVVGSYGVFALSGILGHLYLGAFLYYKRETEAMQRINKAIVQSIYLGTAMLIPGTILGGIWAAESWGRFWDWDPKESWAFISICIYLIWIHAYTFHHIGNFGLALGAIVGMLAISFTWYGVNYILGTGLHSYGFGSGGELYYYAYLLAEISFLLFAYGKISKKMRLT